MEGGSFTDEDYVASFRAADDALDGFRAPGVMERSLALSWGDTPGRVALGLALTDAVVHGWDLAIATGQKLYIDDDIAQALYEMTSGMMAPTGSYPRMTSLQRPRADR
jgi:uncharacterized protein (TIGR03086 family)